MTPPVVKRRAKGDGEFQWNTAGWFGGQIGGSLWLGILGVLVATQDFVAGLWVILCFAVANGVGLVLWGRRDRMSAYIALQVLLAVTSVCALAGIIGLDLRGRLEERAIYGWLLLFPAMMGVFYVRERASRR